MKASPTAKQYREFIKQWSGMKLIKDEVLEGGITHFVLKDKEGICWERHIF